MRPLRWIVLGPLIFLLETVRSPLAIAYLVSFVHTGSWAVLIIWASSALAFLAWQRILLEFNNHRVCRRMIEGLLHQFAHCRFIEIDPSLVLPKPVFDHLERSQLPGLQPPPPRIYFVQREPGLPFLCTHTSYQLDTLPSYIFLATDPRIDPKTMEDSEGAFTRFCLLHELGHTTLLHNAFKRRVELAFIESGLLLLAVAVFTSGNMLYMSAVLLHLLYLLHKAGGSDWKETRLEILADSFAIAHLQTIKEVEIISEVYPEVVQATYRREWQTRTNLLEGAAIGAVTPLLAWLLGLPQLVKYWETHMQELAGSCRDALGRLQSANGKEYDLAMPHYQLRAGWLFLRTEWDWPVMIIVATLLGLTFRPPNFVEVFCLAAFTVFPSVPALLLGGTKMLHDLDEINSFLRSRHPTPHTVEDITNEHTPLAQAEQR